MSNVPDDDLYLAILERVGYNEGAEVHADGSASNDLAHERATAVTEFIRRVKDSSLPRKLLPSSDTSAATVGTLAASKPDCARIFRTLEDLGEHRGPVFTRTGDRLFRQGDMWLTEGTAEPRVEHHLVLDLGPLTEAPPRQRPHIGARVLVKNSFIGRVVHPPENGDPGKVYVTPDLEPTLVEAWDPEMMTVIAP